MSAWWSDYPEQRYWMEKVTRAGFGTELFAPKTNYWSYRLMRLVRPGDVVLHWRTGIGFVGSSVVADSAAIEPRDWAGALQECWIVPLLEFEEFDEPVGLKEVRHLSPQLERTEEVLNAAYPGFKYFPFAFSAKRPLRAQQAYLNKFPVELFEVLAMIGLDAPVVFSPTTGQSIAKPASPSLRPRFLANTELRLGLERHSVDMAKQWYLDQGAAGIIELGKPYDLELVLEQRVRRVEVKGSSLPAVEQVLLTRNEVINARAYPYTDLVVVDGIQYEREDDSYRFSGGELRRWVNWFPEDVHITGLQYQYQLQTSL